MSKLHPQAALDPRDVALTGPPRSGTTLVCHLLNKLPTAVALNEPMKVGELPKLPDRRAMCDAIQTFFADSRRSLMESGTAYSRHVSGKVPDNVVGEARAPGGLRKDDAVRGLIRVDKPLSEGFLLAVKHPVAFSAMLPELGQLLRTFVVIRNPLAILASWNSVEMAFRQGHAPAAENLHPDLRDALAAIPDAVDRQLHLLGWFFARYRDGLDAGQILRYEDVVASGGASLAAITPEAAALREPLTEKNRNTAYSRDTVRELSARLLAAKGAYWDFYSRQDVERLAQSILV